jgi:hypothetical protein
MRNGATTTIAPYLYINLTTGVLFYAPANTNRITGPALVVNTWYHIAVVRIKGISRLYVNGIQYGINYVDANNYVLPTTGPIIGRTNDGVNTAFFTGSISNFRIVKGVGIYTAVFTPLGPLSRIQPARTNVVALGGTETTLLALNDTAPTIDNSINNFTIASNPTVVSMTISQSLGVVPTVNDYVLVTDTVTNNQALAKISVVASTTTSYTLTVPRASLSTLNAANAWAYQLWEADVLPQANVSTIRNPSNARENLYYATLARGKFGQYFPYKDTAITLPNNLTTNKLVKTTYNYSTNPEYPELLIRTYKEILALGF